MAINRSVPAMTTQSQSSLPSHLMYTSTPPAAVIHSFDVTASWKCPVMSVKFFVFGRYAGKSSPVLLNIGAHLKITDYSDCIKFFCFMFALQFLMNAANMLYILYKCFVNFQTVSFLCSVSGCWSWAVIGTMTFDYLSFYILNELVSIAYNLLFIYLSFQHTLYYLPLPLFPP